MRLLPFIAIALTVSCSSDPLAQEQSTTTEPFEAAALVSAFKDLCIATEFSAADVERAFVRRGWNGTQLQHPTASAPHSTWSFDFGQVSVGYQLKGQLRSSSCTVVLDQAAAPPIAALRSAFDESFPPMERVNFAGQSSAYASLLENEPSKQVRLTLSGDRVPFAGEGTVELRPGLLIDYTQIEGPGARRAAGLGF